MVLSAIMPAVIKLIKRGLPTDDYIGEAELGGKIVRPEGNRPGWTFRRLEEFVASKKDRRRGHGEYKSVLLDSPELWVPPEDDPKAAPPALPHLSAEDQARLRALPQTAAAAISSDDIKLIRDSVTARVSARRNKAFVDYISGAYSWSAGERDTGIPEDCNPAKGVSRGLSKRQKAKVAAKAPPKKKRWLTLAEVNHLLAAIDVTEADISVRNALILDLLTAQRKGSLITAKVEDVEFGHPEHGDHLKLYDTKNGQPQHLPLAPIAVAFVRQQLEVARRRNSPWLFASKHTAITGKTISGHISDNAVNDYIERMLKPPPRIERPTKTGRGVPRFDTDEAWARYVDRHRSGMAICFVPGRPFRPRLARPSPAT